MKSNLKVLAIIPARGGSKGIPNKNIKMLAGKPLICHTIDVVKSVNDIHKIVVSTDDSGIAEVAINSGVEVVERPLSLSGDDSLVIDAIRYTIDYLKEKGFTFEIALLLEPTSPFRNAEDILNALAKMDNKQIDSVASFTETKTPPDRIWKKNGRMAPIIKGSNPFLPRQMLEKGYYLNGIIYGIKVNVLKKFATSNSLLLGNVDPIFTPEERVIDIDTERDFALAEFLLKEYEK